MSNRTKVFIKIDDNNRVIDIDSSVFISDTTDWIEVDEGYGDKYVHAQGMYLEKPLFDERFTHNYIYEGNVLRETTEEEKLSEVNFESTSSSVQKSTVNIEEIVEQNKANIEYIAIVSGIELVY